jgi:hypothetical protein
MVYPQQPPFSVRVELTEGCNLRCHFCGIQGIREKAGGHYHFMSEETITSIFTQIRDLRWNPRVEFTMHGEPTMHPRYKEMIQIAYEICPKVQLMLTTNGAGIVRDPGPKANIGQLFRSSGLNILALDDYEGVKLISKIRPHLDEVCRELDIPWYEYPENPEGNPHRRPKGAFVTVIQDLSVSTRGTHSYISNQSSSSAPPSNSMAGRRCHRPFREIAFRWDGNVALCCDDWRGKYRCGHIDEGLLNIWHSEAFDAARRKLIRGERDFGPCDGCTSKTLRAGMLPDKFGKDQLPLPDEETAAIIQRSLEKGPLTTPVLRQWES